MHDVSKFGKIWHGEKFNSFTIIVSNLNGRPCMSKMWGLSWEVQQFKKWGLELSRLIEGTPMHISSTFINSMEQLRR